MPRTVAIIGASSNPRKFGNRAVRVFLQRGYTVWPVNPHETEIEGLTVYRSIVDVPGDVDIVSFYVPPRIGVEIIGEVARKGAGEVWFNPGSESEELVRTARALGLNPIVACSIIGLGKSAAGPEAARLPRP